MPQGQPGGQARAGSWGRSGSQNSALEHDPDEVAVERYRYMLRTAPPEAVEQAHARGLCEADPRAAS